MAFPDDYHINDGLCGGDKWKIHQWSTMGHPLTHRCISCHRPKWVRDNPESNISPQHAQIMGGKRL